MHSSKQGDMFAVSQGTSQIVYIITRMLSDQLYYFTDADPIKRTVVWHTNQNGAIEFESRTEAMEYAMVYIPKSKHHTLNIVQATS